MSKLTDILTQMDKRLTALTAEEAKLTRRLQDQIDDSGITQWRDKELAVARLHEMESAHKARVKTAEAKAGADLDALRREAVDAANEARVAISQAYFDAQHAGDPHGAAQWAEAQAREPFVRQDLEAETVKGMMHYLLNVESRGDTVGRYLAERIARERLTKIRNTSDSNDQTLLASQVLMDLDAQTIGKAAQTFEADMAKIDSILSEIQAPKTSGENVAAVGRYGIRVPDGWMPAPAAESAD